MVTPDKERFADIIAPLAAFCEHHGYRWRWKIEQSGETHWRETVQILDPRHTERRDRVRAWYGCNSLDEAGSLRQAVQYAIDAAQRKLDTEAGKPRLEEHKAELQYIMRNSYDGICI